MNESKKEPLDREKLFQWLRNGDEPLVTAMSSLVRVAKKPDMDYIYGLNNKPAMDNAFTFFVRLVP